MFKVCAEKCDQCLFGENKIVNKERMADILKECRAKDVHFTCHKATIVGADVCCRGFYDTQSSQLMRIAQRLNMVEFVDPSLQPRGRFRGNDDDDNDDDGMFEPEY